MKKLTFVLVLVMIATTTVMTSCSKKSSTSGSTGGTTKFTANGTSYTYTQGSGLVGHTAYSRLQLIANDASNNTLSFLGGSNASGTYSFSAANSLSLTLNGKTYAVTDGNGNATGSITFNISGSTATGTFSTTLYNVADQTDMLVITNGSYSGSYMTTQY